MKTPEQWLSELDIFHGFRTLEGVAAIQSDVRADLEAENKALREKLENREKAWMAEFNRAQESEAVCAEIRNRLYNEALFSKKLALDLTKAEAACADQRFACEQALELLCQGGSGLKYDPSWIRPKTMPIVEMREACTQAYQFLHHALSSDAGNGWCSPERSASLQCEAQMLTEQKAAEIAVSMGYLPPDQRKAMEEILNESRHDSFLHDVRRTEPEPFCTRCRWEKLKSLTPL